MTTSGKSFSEKIEVTGENLVAKVQEIVRDGNARRVIVRDHNGKELITIPLNWGVAGVGVLALAAPVVAAIGAIAAVVTKVQLEVERTDEAASTTDGAADSDSGADGATDDPVI